MLRNLGWLGPACSGPESSVDPEVLEVWSADVRVAHSSVTLYWPLKAVPVGRGLRGHVPRSPPAHAAGWVQGPYMAFSPHVLSSWDRHAGSGGHVWPPNLTLEGDIWRLFIAIRDFSR